MLSVLTHLLSSEGSRGFATWLVLVFLGLWVLRTLVDLGLRVYRHRLARKVIEGGKDMPETLEALRLDGEDGDDGPREGKRRRKH